MKDEKQKKYDLLILNVSVYNQYLIQLIICISIVEMTMT